MARLDCAHYRRGECRSCGWIERDYAEQLAVKQRSCRERVDPRARFDWLPPCASSLGGFRNKAKLVVAGTQQSPTLGILDAEGLGVDLPDCRLYPPAIVDTFPVLRELIRRTALPPYSVPDRHGELKYLLLTLDPPSGGLMLRLVLRSREGLGRIQRELPWLLQALPALRCVSVNLQPRHAALVEGEVEIPLGPDSRLALQVNDVQLALQPGGFWQTNTEVAAALYREAREWVRELPLRRLLDLYCGIGGFAHHLAAAGREVEGIELHPAAVASAQLGRGPSDAPSPRFAIADADAGASEFLAELDLLVLNPPRRGLSETLCSKIIERAPRWLLYSSCNPQTLARDLDRLPVYRPLRARLFDMFPQTPHAEVLVLLAHDPHQAPAGGC
jgi:23S rRNA (uracil747-C5)-methyltransferase